MIVWPMLLIPFRRGSRRWCNVVGEIIGRSSKLKQAQASSTKLEYVLGLKNLG